MWRDGTKSCQESVGVLPEFEGGGAERNQTVIGYPGKGQIAKLYCPRHLCCSNVFNTQRPTT
eukprot:2025322-Rhodomonas_salina.2